MSRLAVLCLYASLAAWAAAAEENPVRHEPAPAVNAAAPMRVIVKFREDAATPFASSAKDAADRVSALAARQNVQVRGSRALGARMHVLEIGAAAAGESLETALERLRADPAIEYAEPDKRRYPLAIPNDLLYPGQWYLQGTSVAASAIDAESAWDVTTGSAGVVVADIDTGVLFNHPDLLRADAGGRLLPGYDFISDPAAANDGDGRDADPSDAGDWVTPDEAASGRFDGCDVTDSSWHGTRVAGILGARTNSSVGIAGATWQTWILPVRALGKCGGFDSDILPAMLWAAGFHIDGVPDNPFPAKIVNLSIGSEDTGCPAAYQDVVDALADAGVTVVASAGNEGGPVDTPANCDGVVGVAGLRQVGTKVGFSSLGPEVAVSAPAGNCVNVTGGPCLFPIDTTTDTGTTGHSEYTYTDQFNINVGTSFSAPIVSAVAALMVSVNGNLGAADLRARLREGARPFPASSDPAVPECHVPSGPNDVQTAECSCTTDTCGAGMVNAPASIEAALRPIAAVAVPRSVSAGQDVALSAAGSAAACGRTVVDYAWSVVGGGASGVGLSSTSGPTTTVTAPSQGTVTVRVKITDDVGDEDTADVIVGPTGASTSARADAGSAACLADIAPPPAPDVTVTISPAQATVKVNATQAFAATVANAGDAAVRWQVNGIDGGNIAVGTISSDGLYTAPGGVPSPNGITITAVSSAYPSATASAQVTIVGSGSGGGGGIDPAALLGLLALVGGRAGRLRSRPAGSR